MTMSSSSRIWRRIFQREKPQARAIPPRTTTTNRKQVRYTQAISPASDLREPRPYLPMVNAIAPNAANGATRETICTMRKKTFEMSWHSWMIGWPVVPRLVNATPKSRATTSTCRTSPPTNAPTKVSGMIWSNCWVVVSFCAAWVYWATAPASRLAAEACIPAPGVRAFATASPMISARVVTPSK